MALEAKLQTKEDISKRFEQIKEYRSYFKFMNDIDINDKFDVDVFNGEKVLFQHTSSDFFFFFMKNLEYDKEHNALIEKINK